jgi:hypothetical protein
VGSIPTAGIELRTSGERATADRKGTTVSRQISEREADRSERGAGLPPGRGPKSRAAKDFQSLWHIGALFHVSHRYPRKRNVAKLDRLASIFRHGLLAPASCPDGSVCSDLNITVTGSAIPYDCLVFLHRFGPQSAIYTMLDPGRFMVFIDPAIALLTPESMGQNWCVLCQDEVYVKDRVPLESLIGVIVHPVDADSVMNDCLAELQRAAIPLYDSEGRVLWRPT